MIDRPDRWPAVGEAIRARIDELHLTKAEIRAKHGISPVTIDAWIKGSPIRRPDKLRALCAALQWSPDSVERILAGKQPQTIEEPIAGDPIVEALAKLTAELAALRAEIRSKLPDDGADLLDN